MNYTRYQRKQIRLGVWLPIGAFLLVIGLGMWVVSAVCDLMGIK